MNEQLLDFDELPLMIGYLDHMQKGVWLDCLLWCKATKPERQLPVEHADIEALLGLTSAAQVRALEVVLLRCFEATSTGYTRKPFLAEQARKLAVMRAATARRQASRERRSALFEQARAAGLNPSFRATMGDLEILLSGSGKVTSLGERRGESPGERLGSGPEECPGFAPVPLSSSSLRSEEGESAHESANRRGRAGKALRRAGMADVNTMHPGFTRLLDAGVTDEELALAAAECVAREKPFAYLLQMVEGRRRDAARKAPVAPAVDVLAQLAPLAMAALREGRDPFALEG